MEVELINEYLKEVSLLFKDINHERNKEVFSPEFELPNIDNKLIKFFSVARAEFCSLGSYKGKNITLLNLMKNEETQTTKTLASLLMVARAINHINKTGESILIFTPSSGNKAIALRDAVNRALEIGLVNHTQLRILTLIPEKSVHKVRASKLTTNKLLNKLNPICVYKGAESQQVKTIGCDFYTNYSKEIFERSNTRVWYSLDINNYKVADALRAYFCYHYFPSNQQEKRQLHAHSVSSAYGLLGYDFGKKKIENETNQSISSGYLLIQHLDTCDMVLSLLYGSFSRKLMPKYILDKSTGLFKQLNNHFPLETWDVNESLESTFYTHKPSTSFEMNRLIEANGGSGIVVSMYECIKNIGKIREMLKSAGIQIPIDIRDINEWSLIMAFTGVINSIDRGIINEFDDIVVHGSGFYTKTDYESVNKNILHYVESHEDIISLV
ncbi:DUF6002 family protein [Aliivibrio fischeri]|uniref:Uncharacterized protein n=1 Tax=Aliivibrio fischeri TaxID=668 RepID=A0A510UJN9_ALIFS|nr:DUF6002 family protein [Aliivibrio fischeri]GEK14862.1 hypothetical protein AFI02nite_28980 [Aliivibrio fischeri]